MHLTCQTHIRLRILMVATLFAALSPVLTVDGSETLPFENARSEVLDYFDEQIDNESLGQAGIPLAAIALVSGRRDLVARFVESNRIEKYDLWIIWEYICPHADKRDIEFLLEVSERRFPDFNWQLWACELLGESGRLDYALTMADTIECKSDRKLGITRVARVLLLRYGDVAGARRVYIGRDSSTTETDFSALCENLAQYLDHGKKSVMRQTIGLPMADHWKILVDERAFLEFLLEHHELTTHRHRENHADRKMDDNVERQVERIIGTLFLSGIRAAAKGDLNEAQQRGKEIDKWLERGELPESIRDATWLPGGRVFLAMLGRDREFLRRCLTSEVSSLNFQPERPEKLLRAGLLDQLVNYLNALLESDELPEFRDTKWLPGSKAFWAILGRDRDFLGYRPEELLIASLEIGLLDEVIDYLNAKDGDNPLPVNYTGVMGAIGVAWLRAAGSFERFRVQLERVRDARIRMQVLSVVLLSGEHHVVGPAFE